MSVQRLDAKREIKLKHLDSIVLIPSIKDNLLHNFVYWNLQEISCCLKSLLVWLRDNLDGQGWKRSEGQYWRKKCLLFLSVIQQSYQVSGTHSICIYGYIRIFDCFIFWIVHISKEKWQGYWWFDFSIIKFSNYYPNLIYFTDLLLQL